VAAQCCSWTELS
jgi:hypothetical protein